jgi:hypothetical protein
MLTDIKNEPSVCHAVFIAIEIDGRSYDVSHLAPTFLRIKSPLTSSPREVFLWTRVNNCEHRRRIYLPDGLDGSSKRQCYVALEEAETVY